MNLLIATTINPDLPNVLKDRCKTNLANLLTETRYYCSADLAIYDEKVDVENRMHRLAIARNKLLDQHLTDEYDYVLWIDADIVDYPLNLVKQLHSINPEAIIAPLVLLEGTKTLYDCLGFIYDSEVSYPASPHFRDTSEPVEMDSVGACYLIPAYVYKHAKYGYTPVDRTNHHWSTWVTGHTDHWSIMTIAKHTLGVSILCTRKVKVYHADLQKYGVGLNESRQQRKSLQ